MVFYITKIFFKSWYIFLIQFKNVIFIVGGMHMAKHLQIHFHSGTPDLRGILPSVDGIMKLALNLPWGWGRPPVFLCSNAVLKQNEAGLQQREKEQAL